MTLKKVKEYVRMHVFYSQPRGGAKHLSLLHCNRTYNLIYITYNNYIPASHKISVKLILCLWITGHHQNVTAAFCSFSPHRKTALSSLTWFK